MFPLKTQDIPATSAALRDALAAGVAQLFGGAASPAGPETKVQATAYPKVALLSVDATGCNAREDVAHLAPENLQSIQHALVAERLVLKADPLYARDAPVKLELDARNVAMDFAADSQKRLYLVPASHPLSSTGADVAGTPSGQVMIEADKASLMKVLRSFIDPLAEKNGLKVSDVELDLKNETPRVVRLSLAATGKKLLLKARLRATGRLTITDDLTAVIDQLQVEGEGMLGDIAKSLIQPKLKDYEGHRIKLAGFSLGGLRLGDLQVDASNGIRATASLIA